MDWLNNETVIHKAEEVEKPCHLCGYCPYGQLVEAFRLQGEDRDEISCRVFGHDCPAYYMAENIKEEDGETKEPEMVQGESNRIS